MNIYELILGVIIMPVYKVELLSTDGATLVDGKVGHVVAAADTTDALDTAKSQNSNPGDDARWDALTPLLLAGTTDSGIAVDMTGWSCKVNISDDADATAEINVDVTCLATDIGFSAAAINGGGTGYAVGDILTIQVGTFTKEALLRVTSESGNVIDGIEIIDPGVYSVVPANDVAVTGGGGGDDADFTMTASTAGISVLMSRVVTALNADLQIAAAIFTPGDDTLLLAEGSGADDLGDKIVVMTVRNPNGGVVAGFVGVVTDDGSTTDDLTVVSVAESYEVPHVIASI